MTRKKTPHPGPKRPNIYGNSRKELKYYGNAACLALWQQRPDDIIRIYVTQEQLKTHSAMLKWAAATQRAYHIVDDADLARLTESIHHQGVCLLAREHASTTFVQLKQSLSLNQQTDACLIGYLDGVENPHNLGAIVRTCAHLGIKYLLGESGRLPKLSASACRVAEGGAEHVKLIPVNDPLRTINELKKLGFAVLTTAAQGSSLYSAPLPRRTLLVMGAEQTGVSPALQKLADVNIKIPGSGLVESLNVSVAFAIIAAEFIRQQR